MNFLEMKREYSEATFIIFNMGIITFKSYWSLQFLQCHIVRDHPFKTSVCLGGEGCSHVPMVKRSQYIRIKNPLHKHFAGMPMVGGVGVKNRENLPTS